MDPLYPTPQQPTGRHGSPPFLLPEPDDDGVRTTNSYTIAGIVLGVFLAVVTVAVLVAAVVVAIRAQ